LQLSSSQLLSIGWNSRLDIQFQPHAQAGLSPARVAAAHRDLCILLTESGELSAEVSGRFRLQTALTSGFPAAGDWVAASLRPQEGKATIHAVLPRSSAFTRKAAGERVQEQVIAANIDTAIIVMGLDGDYNLKRLERYLTLAWGSGAVPLVVLNKSDLCEDPDGRRLEVEAAAIGVTVLLTAAEPGQGLGELHTRLAPGTTAALLGSSGVGKSTILNRLLGERHMDTAAVREDDSRGRHTTTHRELVVLPSGAMVIDNPGLREVGLWGDEEALEGSFPDVEELARSCRFSDCRHDGEPGCAVRRAVADGSLAPERFESWRKLQRELRFLARRADESLRRAQLQRSKSLAKFQKRFRKDARF